MLLLFWLLNSSRQKQIFTQHKSCLEKFSMNFLWKELLNLIQITVNSAFLLVVILQDSQTKTVHLSMF